MELLNNPPSLNRTDVEAQGNTTHLRRDFMRGITAVLGAAATAGIASAQTTTPQPLPSPQNDLDILNYALTLELLEATFYTQALARFTSADFSQAAFIQALRTASGVSGTPPMSGSSDTGLAQDVYAYFSLIRNHEQAHVRTLTATIRSLGGTPIATPTFKFPYNTVDEFVVLAQTLENTGVAAYNGAIDKISNPALVTASATIATVEARHAAYLNRLRGMNPFPDAFDAGKTMAEVLQIAAPFIG